MIVVVEDDEVLRRSVTEFLQAKGHDVEAFAAAEPALQSIRQSPPDVLLTDVQLPGMSGLELMEHVAEVDGAIIRVAMTARATVQAAVRAMRSGCFEYLEKPVDLEQLARLLERALAERQSSRERAWQRTRSEGSGLADALMGHAAPMETIRRQIAALQEAQGEVPPVLLVGETGAGKGLVAKAIHRARSGPDAPWIEVNCAALPANLVEGELFGHEKSAFTDAKAAKPGLFEAAHGGTIFLDEVGELPLDIQAKLLQVLESRRVRRLGALRDRPFQAAILAATNVDLQKAIAAGRFRQDLYHRLAALTLHVPALRERGDALEVAHIFLRDAAARYRKNLTGLSDAAQRRIRSYPWPGNIRELRFALERAVLLAPADATTLPADLLTLENIVGAPPTPGASAAVVVASGGIRVELPEAGIAFEELEKAILSAALGKTGGNVVQAARLLGMNRDALRYRMKKFGLGEKDG